MTARMLATRIGILSLLSFILGVGFAHADTLGVNVNTSGLGSGNFEIFFLLIGTGANTVTVTNIGLGGGTAGPVDTTNAFGSGALAINNLGAGISLTDSSDFLNVFGQSFQAGSNLSFLLNLTNNIVSPTPDQFGFAILDPTGNFLPSSDPTGSGNLFVINIDSAIPTSNIYSNLVTISTTAPVPEPSSLLLLGSGLFSLVPFLRIHRRKSAQRQRPLLSQVKSRLLPDFENEE